jgi:hypothetical protein
VSVMVASTRPERPFHPDRPIHARRCRVELAIEDALPGLDGAGRRVDKRNGEGCAAGAFTCFVRTSALTRRRAGRRDGGRAPERKKSARVSRSAPSCLQPSRMTPRREEIQILLTRLGDGDRAAIEPAFGSLWPVLLRIDASAVQHGRRGGQQDCR